MRPKLYTFIEIIVLTITEILFFAYIYLSSPIMRRLRPILLFPVLLLTFVCQAYNEPTRRELLLRRDSLMRSRLAAIKAARGEQADTGVGPGPSRLPSWSSREGYDVGQIPYEEGVSPSGARTYTVPITVIRLLFCKNTRILGTRCHTCARLCAKKGYNSN